MNPLDLLQAIRAHAGGGAPGPGGPSGPPPGPGDGNPISALLASGGPGGPGAAPPGPGGPPPGAGAGPGGGDFSSIVKKMIQLGIQAQQAAPDPQDASGMAQIVAKLHQFEASAASDQDAALGVSPAIRAMRRAAPSAG